MEQQVKTKVQFSDDYNAFTNLENNDSLSTGFGKMHYDLGYLNSEDQRQESEINAIAQAGSKNICPIGTETHSSEIGFGTEYSFPMPEGAYIISFTGTMVAPIQFNVYSESGTRIALVDIHTIEEAESGVRFVLNDNATKYKFWYDTSDNYILSNIMIRDANITDNTFQPYSPTNRELYTALGGKQDTISDLETIRSGAALGATSVQDIQINGTTQTKTSGVVNLPAYPTKSSLGLGNVDNTSDLNKPISTAVAASQAAQDAEIAVIANAGAKNFLDVQHPTTTTRTSYTPLANGGVELSCSSAIWTSYNIADIPVEAGKEYIITFLLDESSGTSNFYFFLRNDNSSGTNLATKSYGSTTGIYEASFTPNTSVIWLGIYLNNSATAATATAKLRCMLRPAAITDPTYEPYAKTNVELTGENASQQAEIDYAVNTGAKNLLRNEKNAGATVERQGATWVFDQTSVEAKVSGSVSNPWSDVYLLDSNLDLSDKEYTVVVESDSPNLFIYIPGNTLSGGNIPSNGQYYSGVYKYKGIMTTSTRFTAKTASYSNNTIRCMICPAFITNSTFVPYAKTNRELTVAEDEDRAEIATLQGYHTINTVSSTAQNPASMDTFTNLGIYAVGGVNTASTITHAPFTAAGFIFEVVPTHQLVDGVRGVAQNANSYISGQTVYKCRRYLYGSGVWAWTEWETVGTGTR